MRDNNGEEIDQRLSLTYVGILLAFELVLNSFNAPLWLQASFIFWAISSATVVLAMGSPSRRNSISAFLRTGNFTHFYRFPVQRILDFLWPRLCLDVANNADTFTIFKSALTWRLYDKALLFAVTYPILALVVMWIVIGNDATLGATPIISAAGFWPSRTAMLGAIAITVLGHVLRSVAATSRHRYIQQISGWLPILATSFSAIFLLPLETAFLVAIAFVLIFPFNPVAIALALSGAGPVAFICAMAVAAIIWDLDTKNRHRAARLFLTLALPIFWALTLWLLPWADISDKARAIFLFLGVFPLINALLDVVSYAITLTLLKRGLYSKHPLFLGLLDLIAALVLFMSLGMILIAVLTAMNTLAGIDLINMRALFDGIKKNPSDYIWLYLMMFSTILPTAVHAALATLGIQSFLLPFIRRPVATFIDRAPNDPLYAAFASMAVGALLTLPTVALGWVFYVLWPYIDDIAKSVGWSIYGVMRNFAQYAGAF